MNRRIAIDFAAPGWRRTLFQAQPALLLAALLGVMLCAGAAWSGYATVSQRQAVEARLQRMAQHRAASAARPDQPSDTLRLPPEQAAAINAAVQQLNLPWRALQDAVAAATPPGVALLALEPDARKQVLKITAEVRSSDAMIAYIEQIKQQDVFTGVLLTRHEINEQDPARPLRFQCEATWTDR